MSEHFWKRDVNILKKIWVKSNGRGEILEDKVPPGRVFEPDLPEAFWERAERTNSTGILFFRLIKGLAAPGKV